MREPLRSLMESASLATRASVSPITEFAETIETLRFSGALSAFVVGVDPSAAMSTESAAKPWTMSCPVGKRVQETSAFGRHASASC